MPCSTGEDNLPKVIAELSDISKVEALALNLGMRMSAWQKIMAEYPQQVEKQKMLVLYYWLKRMKIIESKQSERPTWIGLAEAVAGFDPAMSERIRRQYC